MQTAPDSHSSPSPSQSASPNYERLVRFLVEPFLDSPDSLRLDCEVSPRTARVLIRLAIEGEDKGRVFGRGGRNIQAIRTVIQAVAQAAGQAAHIEIFGGHSIGREHTPKDSFSDEQSPERSDDRAVPRPQPAKRAPQPRPR
ncbi:MAG TPA: KH domain-containing protein [Trichocoleus sp.]|jgi:predicted RNA-binding protein YlqC (UPF0109 family)